MAIMRVIDGTIADDERRVRKLSPLKTAGLLGFFARRLGYGVTELC